MSDFDCVVIGGGMVGAASALALAEQGLRVAVVEKYQPDAFTNEQTLDLRVSAISLGSQFLLEQLGAWSQIKQWRVCPYKRLGVWEKEFAYTEFNAADIKQPYLGHIVENRLIQLALWQQIAEHDRVTLFCPEQLVDIKQDNDKVTVILQSLLPQSHLSQSTSSQNPSTKKTSTKNIVTKSITAKLLIGADGANSQVRQLVNIGITTWDYQQSAMLINVETAQGQQDITWQQFFPTGPVAFLPLAKKQVDQVDNVGYASLVWYHQRDEIKRLAALSNTQLQQEVLAHFPKRLSELGELKVIDKAAFPLTRRHANTYQHNRVLLLGDAAHTINPMAGQGVNLGFKDVKALQNVIACAIADGKCWSNIDVLAQYEKVRRKDNLLMQSTMDALYFGFSHPSPLIKTLRNVSLLALNKVPFVNSVVKNKALAYACGI
ncbi:MAG: FAD-dependent oxidoreductase [Colwellia sp.]|nr:FAD-dependent oxidoreductase [Colwellia sp.]